MRQVNAMATDADFQQPVVFTSNDASGRWIVYKLGMADKVRRATLGRSEL